MSTTMNAIQYSAARRFSVTKLPIPTVANDEVLIKVSACGVCGTDGHIHQGEFISRFPLVPGHEIVGTIHSVGKDVQGFSTGDRVVADNTILCDSCFYCRRLKPLFCEHFDSHGVTCDGGFAEYVSIQAKKVFAIHGLTDEEAIMVEPTACAVHGMDVLRAPVGVDALVIGAGPTGLVLAQLLKLNGAARVTLAANKGIKTEIARKLNIVDELIELDRQDAATQWEKIKTDNPYGFDVVVEATGSEAVANDALNYVRRGGTLLVYGVYADEAKIHWPPAKIFRDEITIKGSFAQTHCFDRAIAYLESGKVKVKDLVTDTFGLYEYQQALDKMNAREALKVCIKP